MVSRNTLYSRMVGKVGSFSLCNGALPSCVAQLAAAGLRDEQCGVRQWVHYHVTDKELQLRIGLVCSGVLVLHPNDE